MRACVVCGGEVDTKKGTIIRHTADHGCRVKSGAGHYSHALCLDADAEIGCAACARAGPAGPPGANEPKTARDYIDFPVPQTTLTELRKRWLVPLTNVNRDREDMTDPVALIRLGPVACPVPWLVKTKQIGLHHALEAGALIDDFLRAGYTLVDLQHFQDLDPVRTPQLDRRQRAWESLGLQAEHLRDHRSALPIDRMRTDHGMTPQFIHESLGLGIAHTPVGPAGGVCGWNHGARGDPGWIASDLVYLGFTYQHLLNMGLEYRVHWDQLMAVQSDVDAMGASVNDIAALLPSPAVFETTPDMDEEVGVEAFEPPMALPRSTSVRAESHAPLATTMPIVIPKRRPLPFGLKKR